MDKQKRAELYKSKNGGIDPKALRAHRRSIEWKSFRNTEVNKRRNISEDLTPVKEAKDEKRLTKAEIKRQQANDKRAQLEKWKKEKELKKKLEAQRKAPVFKVKHCSSKEYERLEAERLKQRKATVAAAAQRKPPTRPAQPKPPVKKSVPSKAPPAKSVPSRAPPAKSVPTKAPPASTKQVSRAPVHTTRTTRTTRTATTREAKRPAPATTGRVTRSRAAATTAVPQNKKKTETKKKTPVASKVTRRSESPKTPQTEAHFVNTTRGGLILGYSDVSEFTFNAPFEFKPLTPRSTRKMLGGEELSPIPWANKRCSTPRDARQSVLSPPVSAIPEKAPKEVKKEGSPSKPLPEPVLKLTDVMASSPARASRRRSTRRSALATENEATMEDEPATDKPQEVSSPQVSKSSKTTSQRRRSRRSVTNSSQVDEVETVKEEVEEEKNGASSEAEKVVPQRRRSTRRSAASGSSSEDETKKGERTSRTSPLSSTSESIQVLEKNVSSASFTMATNEGLEAIMEEVEPPVGKAVNQSAPANLEKCDVSSVFRTPRSVTKAAHRRTMSDVLSLSASAKRTPKALRNSFILRHLSPEEGVEVLKMSPMIEMNRRTPKPTSPLAALSPMPTFEDIDDYVPRSSLPLKDSISNEKQEVEAKENIPNSAEEAPVNPTAGEDTNGTTASTEEPSSASGAPEAGAASGPVVHDIPYFRSLLVTETDRLNGSCGQWEKIMLENTLTEEVEGEIRTTIGKAQLLIAQRFKQFRGLVDNCEFKTGEKETTCQDLDGFWDMVFFQVEDVDSMFKNLEKLQANNWEKEKPKVVKKKMVKKNPVASKPGAKKPAGGRSKMADFIAAKRKAQEEKERLEAEKLAAASKEAEGAPEVVINSPVTDAPAAPGSETKEVTLSGGSFVVSSPGKSPRNFSKADTPRKSLGRKSKGLTPAGCTPLMRCVLMNNARKSIGANSIPRPASRRSSMESDESTADKGRRRSNSEQSTRSRTSLASQSNVEKTPKVDSTEVNKLSQWGGSAVKEPMSPVISAIANSHSIFTPEQETGGSRLETPTSTRSTRRSVAPMEVEPVEPVETEVTAEADELFTQYLLPSSAENTQTPEPEPIDPDLSDVEDVDMAAKSKRDLVSEFNQHSKSAKKRRNSSATLPASDFTSVLTPRQDTSLRRTRRSVHFSSQVAAEDEEKVTAKIPGTPANHDSLVPALIRGGAKWSEEEQKENHEEALVSPETPTAKLARLQVETPGVRTRRSMSLLFTPLQTADTPEPEDGTVNLMSFSPSVMSQLHEAAKGYQASSPANRRPRRQSRLSLL